MRFVSNLHSCKPKIETLPNLLYFYTRRSTAMYFGASGLMAMGLYFAFGMVAVKFFFLQAFWAIILFESVNYLEHYGLERRQNKNGTHETVKPQHS